MKKLFLMLASLLVLSTAAFAADPAVGLWKSIDDKTGKVTAIWRVYEQDGMLLVQSLLQQIHHKTLLQVPARNHTKTSLLLVL